MIAHIRWAVTAVDVQKGSSVYGRMRTFKTLIATALLAASIVGALAQTHVRGYYRKDGTYVEPHWRSNPDSTTYENWSTRGNVNPYTGVPGTREDDGLRHYRGYRSR